MRANARSVGVAIGGSPWVTTDARLRFRFPDGLSEPERRLAEHAGRHGFTGVLTSLRDVRRVNNPAALGDARMNQPGIE